MEANMSWVTDTLATGGDLTYDIEQAVAQVNDICRQGVNLIVDCRAESSDATLWTAVAEQPGMWLEDPTSSTIPAYLHLPTDDRAGHHIPADLFDRAVDAALPVLNGGGKVFVHCHMGINRGPSVAFGILLALGLRPTEAFDLIRAKREQAAVLYAEDALDAHLKREGANPSIRARQARHLRERMDEVWTTEERNRIARIIRDNHRADSESLTAARLSGTKW